MAQEAHAIPGKLIVHFKDAASEQVALKYLSAESHFSSYPLSTDMHIDALDLGTVHAAVLAHEWLRKQQGVIAVQYDHRLNYRSTFPTDTMFAEQWYLHNSGGPGHLAGADIKGPEAWDSATGGLTAYGDTIVVAVIDVKFDLTHPDLNYFSNRNEIAHNGIDDDHNGYIDDSLGWNAYAHNDDVGSGAGAHATQLAGIVGAKHNGLNGIVGVNWGVKIMPLYTQAVESQAVEAYSYLVAMRKLYMTTGGTKGAFVVASNSSFGIDAPAPITDYPIWCAMYDSMGKYGIISAAATTNNHTDVDADGDMPTACLSNFMISVTSTNGMDIYAGYGYGDSTVDVAAPGIGIYSCMNGGGYGSGNGNSFASPMVAGEAALLLSYACTDFMDFYYSHPDSAILFIKQCIMSGVDVLPSLSGLVGTGGRINLYKGVQQMNGYSCAGCNSSIVVNFQNPSCYQSNTGQASVTNLSLGMPLRYQWSTGDTTASVSGLSQGTYFVSVTDTAGCVRINTIRLQDPLPMHVGTLSVVNAINSNPGSININGAGGASPYDYSIDSIHYQSPSLFSGLAADTYRVYIRDAHHCIYDTTVIVQHEVGIFSPNSELKCRLIENPAMEELNVEIGGIAGAAIDLQVYDLLGRPLMAPSSLLSSEQPHIQKIAISALPKGLYLLGVERDHALIKTLKFSKL
jgi:Subtilase family